MVLEKSCAWSLSVRLLSRCPIHTTIKYMQSQQANRELEKKKERRRRRRRMLCKRGFVLHIYIYKPLETPEHLLLSTNHGRVSFLLVRSCDLVVSFFFCGCSAAASPDCAVWLLSMPAPSSSSFTNMEKSSANDLAVFAKVDHILTGGVLF